MAEVIQRWLTSACLIFALDLAEQEQSGFRYALSCYQLEYSRNLVFKRGTEVDRIFQGTIDRTRTTLDVKTLKTIFGAKHRPFKHKIKSDSEPRLQRILETPAHDLTVFKLHFGLLTLKIYDKGEYVLRIEAIAHNVKALKCGKVLSKLPELVSALEGMLIRFLNVLRAAHPAYLDQTIVTDLMYPTQTGTSRIAGIDVRLPRMRSAMKAVLTLSASPNGFGLQDLARTVRTQNGWDDNQYTMRHAAYDLKKLRGKEIITRIKRSRRYHPNMEKYQTACAAVILHEKVFTPILSGITHQNYIPKRDNQHELDQHYNAISRELIATMQAVGIVGIAS